MAGWAVRCAPAADYDSLQWCAADWAVALVATAVNLQGDRVIPGLSLYVLKGREGRSFLGNGGHQHLSNVLVETVDLRVRKRVRRPQRMNIAEKQRFVDVDVAESRDKLLVQQDRLDLPGPSPEPVAEVVNGKCVSQRLRTESLLEQIEIRLVHRRDAPEFSLIAESQLLAVPEQKCQPLVAEEWV